MFFSQNVFFFFYISVLATFYSFFSLQPNQVYLYDSKTKKALVQHDDLVLVAAIIHDVTQGQERGLVGQNGTAPNRVSFMRNEHFLLISSDGII